MKNNQPITQREIPFPPDTYLVSRTDLKGIIDRTRFAISNEETRYYLNGIYFPAATAGGTEVLRGVATDGHRLARVEVLS